MMKTPFSMRPVQISRRQVVLGTAALLLVRFSGGAAMAQARTFLIFFAKDSAEISDLAMKIVTAIGGFIKSNTRVTIAGHCDTSEKDPGKLSDARAQAVFSALMNIVTVTNPDNAVLTASGKGTADQHVPTGPNVSEPQNRYVSISIQ